MTLLDISISSYLYTSFSNYEKNYSVISNRQLDLRNQADVDSVLSFLRDWGCRQFKILDHTISSDSLKSWYIKYQQSLSPHSIHLHELDDEQIHSYATMFDDLKSLHASVKTKKDKNFDTTFGAVGAAKTLFGLRKNVFPPWDNPIIKHFKFENTGKGYSQYLVTVKNELRELESECQKSNRRLLDLPSALNRPFTSLPKLIDEFYWITITKKLKPRDIINLVENGR